jgi:hypothetical protein
MIVFVADGNSEEKKHKIDFELKSAKDGSSALPL